MALCSSLLENWKLERVFKQIWCFSHSVSLKTFPFSVHLLAKFLSLSKITENSNFFDAQS